MDTGPLPADHPLMQPATGPIRMSDSPPFHLPDEPRGPLSNSNAWQYFTDPNINNWEVLFKLLPELKGHQGPEAIFTQPPLPDHAPYHIMQPCHRAYNQGYNSSGPDAEIDESAFSADWERQWAKECLFQYYSMGAAHKRKVEASLPPPRSPSFVKGPSHNLKIKEPDSYYGERKKFESFVAQLNLSYSAAGASWSDQDRITFAGSFLRGDAQRWFLPHLDQYTGITNWLNYADFFKDFRMTFSDTNPQATAESEIRNLRQGRDSASTYKAKFGRISSYLAWNDAALLATFRAGLNDSLKSWISMLSLYSSHNLDTLSYHDFALKVIECDNNMRQREAELSAGQQTNRSREQAIGTSGYRTIVERATGGRRPQHGSQPVTRTPNQQTQYELRHQRAPQPAAQHSAPAQYSVTQTTATGQQPGPMDLSAIATAPPAKPGKLTQAEKTYRAIHRLCLYCGQPGHIVSNCPNKGANRAANITAQSVADQLNATMPATINVSHSDPRRSQATRQVPVTYVSNLGDHTKNN